MTDNEIRAHDITMELLMREYIEASKKIPNPDIVNVYKALYDSVLESVNRAFTK